MTSDEIRERFLSFFQERAHERIESASLVPPPSDRSVLLTTAGMQPLKPYFLGQERPPAQRLTSCQKCFRAVDIDKVGDTTRHLTFFEMLGNFSIGDYFKREAIQFAWELSREVFGFPAQDIWVTVFAGDEQLGLGPDEEAISMWLDAGVPKERIVRCPRSENFWEAGAVGPSGPSSELYLDRGLRFGAPEDLPGGENERFLEYWNLVFMSYNQDPPDQLQPLPTRNIDTGLGLNRMAAILQGKDSVFETDQFRPLMDLGAELGEGAESAEDAESADGGEAASAAQRARRILADHSRALTFLIADGVVPSNEERGYVLRRVMRRAVQQGRSLRMESGFLRRYAGLVVDLMGSAYPELHEQREAIMGWAEAEEQGFGRTLDQGMEVLNAHIARALEAGEQSVPYEEVFKLHDTFGFPFEVTKELLAEHGLGVDAAGFERLMEGQRARARAAAAGAGEGEDGRAAALALAEQSDFTTSFTGYETEVQRTAVGALAALDDGGGSRYIVKLLESPFYATGGGQVADVGTLECEHGDCRAHVAGVVRLGEDQALEVTLERGELTAGEPVVACVDHASRHATECNHTATHLLHAALRARLGSHVRQAGSYVGPDKLRFDFTHAQALSEGELREVEDQVNAWIAQNDPVRPLTTTLAEARRLGAMALFGEKYGEVVRMVEVGGFSRELCGGTHVRSTAEIGLFHVLSETSSAANVRRIEALTGPVAAELARERLRAVQTLADELRTRPEDVLDTVRERMRERRDLELALQREERAAGEADVEELAGGAETIAGVPIVLGEVTVSSAKALPVLVDRVKGRLGADGAIVLASAIDGRAALIASVAPALVERGLRAGELVKAAASVVGGGGGGRDTMAQAGGRDGARIGEALQTAREAIEQALADSA